MAKRKEKKYKINYEIGTYYPDTGESVVGVLPPPSSIKRNIKEAFASIGIAVSVTEKTENSTEL